MIDNLVRKQIKTIPQINWGDIPDREVIRLLWGENPLVEQVCIDAIRQDLQNISLYPSPTKSKLKALLATYNNILSENISPTNGSDEAIELLAKVFISEQDEVILPVPSFPVYESTSLMMGANIKKIPLAKDFSLDSKKILHAITEKTKIIWIPNPNNPTGNLLFSVKQIENLVKRIRCLVVIDECYYELTGTTAIPLVKTYSNVIVLRSVSKVFGLAGVRLGYIVADKQAISYIDRLKLANQVFSVNRFALAAGEAIFKNNDLRYLAIRKFILLKEQFEKLLLSIPEITVVPTYTTFCLLNIQQTGISAGNLKDCLIKKGIYIKDCSMYQDLGQEYVYMGIPKEKDQEKVVNVIKDCIKLC